MMLLPSCHPLSVFSPIQAYTISNMVDLTWSFAHEVKAVLVLAPASTSSRRTLPGPILRAFSIRQHKER